MSEHSEQMDPQTKTHALLAMLIEHQAETNALLALLVEEQRALVNALAEGEADDEQEALPATYLDGKPRNAGFS